MYLAQGHNANPLMRLEPATPQTLVKHSTTEPLCSHLFYSSNSHFVQRSGTVCAILVQGIIGNMMKTKYKNSPLFTGCSGEPKIIKFNTEYTGVPS